MTDDEEELLVRYIEANLPAARARLPATCPFHPLCAALRDHDAAIDDPPL